MDLPRDLRLALLDRAHRACLHRLRGAAQVLGGWATLGLPAKDGEETLRSRMLEVQQVTEWVDELWHIQAQPTPNLCREDLIAWLLAASLRIGTPQEAKDPIPEFSQVEAGLAFCAGLELVAGQSPSPKFRMENKDGYSIHCKIQGPLLNEISAEMKSLLSPWLEFENLAADEIGFSYAVTCQGLQIHKGKHSSPSLMG
ncbi:MAG: hypothetical protein HQ519_03170 [Planctomycetes bacterium]|nr:hypothetical protein [Planctomycetota bacterium]